MADPVSSGDATALEPGAPAGAGMPPAGRTPVGAQLLRVVGDGLPERPGPRRRVIVLGAGMAGLVAAYELARAGHEPVLLEAQNRVGGRVHTLRTFAPGLYAEAGAMRIPAVHELTLAYCRAFGLRVRPFVMECPAAPVYLAGRRTTFAEMQARPDLLPFELTPSERGRSVTDLWAEATREVRELYQREGQGAHELLGRDYDGVSIRDFLTRRGFSAGALELFGLLSYREANMGASVVELLRELVGRAFEDMQEIAGGMDQLPGAFYARIRRHVRLGAHVTAVRQDGESVTVTYRTAAGTTSVTGDACICTLPFGVLRHLDFSPPLSVGKYRAIRSLNYNPSTKILLQVRRRFWEDEGIVGGATPTDLPIRRIVYPSHPPQRDDVEPAGPGGSGGDGAEQRGVLLASYTWGQDAARWGALSESDRIALALKDVAKIHPQVRDLYEGGASYSWYSDPYAVGAFALFEPGQETALQRDIVRPEGLVHFAGEHCSLWHAWIQGALESGVRAAAAVHTGPAPVRAGPAPPRT